MIKTFMDVSCETKDILALKAVDTRGEYGDMIKLFMTSEQKKKEIMDAYFKKLFGGSRAQGRNQKRVDTNFKDRSGRWEDYKSEAELENERTMERLKGQYYLDMMHEF